MLAKPLSIMTIVAGLIGSYWYAMSELEELESPRQFLRSLWETIQRDLEDFESGEYLKWGDKRQAILHGRSSD